MEDCTKVLVYGSFDGFAHSTDSSLLISVVLDGGEKVEIPEEFIVSADQMVNKYKIKLKDVIARIKSLDVGIQEVWLDKILKELGSDYGSLKYRAGYEQGRFDCAMEREKVTVPQFVADWYEEHKDDFGTNLFNAIDLITRDFEDGDLSEFEEWFIDGKTKPFQTLVNMHQFGYTVAKEKRYLVKMKNLRALFCYLAYIPDEGYWTLMASGGESIVIKHTRKQLEEAGFGWVFDCPGIEIEEVEE